MSLSLTIVIPTLNRKQYLESTLRDLEEQDYPDFNIVIIDQSDEVYNYNIPSKIASKVRVIPQLEKSASKARNNGLLNSVGDIVLFLDDDIIIDNRSFLSNHCRHYVRNDCPGVSGAILEMDKKFRSNRHQLSLNPRFGWLFFPINYSKACLIGNGWAGNLSVRREWALKIGGMDENYVKGAFREESDFCSRLVKKYGLLQFDPDAFIVHIGASSGGLRTFGKEKVVRGRHHFNGFFYYLLRNVRLWDYPLHILSFVSVFYKRKNLIQNPSTIFTLIARTIKGFTNGILMALGGPKLINQQRHLK